jgi:hypothetical protein
MWPLFNLMLLYSWHLFIETAVICHHLWCVGYHLCKMTSSVGSLPSSLSDEIRSQHKAYLQSTIVDDLLKSKQSNGLCTVDGMFCAYEIVIWLLQCFWLTCCSVSCKFKWRLTSYYLWYKRQMRSVHELGMPEHNANTDVIILVQWSNENWLIMFSVFVRHPLILLFFCCKNQVEVVASSNTYFAFAVRWYLVIIFMSEWHFFRSGISSHTGVTIDDVLATLKTLHLPVDHDTGYGFSFTAIIIVPLISELCTWTLIFWSGWRSVPVALTPFCKLMSYQRPVNQPMKLQSEQFY